MSRRCAEGEGPARNRDQTPHRTRSATLPRTPRELRIQISTGTSYAKTYQGWWLFTFFSSSRQYGKNQSTSSSRTKSESTGTSSSRSDSRSFSATDGWSESVHKRPLLNPDEIGRFLSRIDDSRHAAYPGLLLAIMPGQHPLVARRVSYFQSRHFEGLFDPHPDHPPPPTLAEVARLAAARTATASIWESKTKPDIIEQLRKVSTPTKKPRRLPQKARDALIWGGLIGAVALGFFVQENWKNLEASIQSGTTAEQPTQSAAFDQGLADRRTWESWFNSLNGDAQAGAMFWGTERSKQNPKPCYLSIGSAAATFRQGCVAAKQFLDPTDVRRRTEPDYRQGWNSY